MSDGSRDLACAEYWEESLERSRRRREAAERQLNFGPIDAKRIAVPAALLAGGSAVAAVVTTGGGGSGGEATAASVEAEQVDALASDPLPTEAMKAPAAKPSPAKRSPAKRSATKRKKPVVVQTIAQAQQLGGFKKGMRGPGVIQLQRRLGVTADGIYGSTTLKAVHLVQKRSDLNTDGIVGPATWRAISSPKSSST